MFAQKIAVLLCLFYAAGLLPEWADVDEFGAGPGKDRPGRQRDDHTVRVSATFILSLFLLPSIISTLISAHLLSVFHLLEYMCVYLESESIY